MADNYMDFSPAAGLWNYLVSPAGPQRSAFPELDRPTAPTPQERMRSVPKATPYNASLGPDQNRMQPNIQAPDQSILLDAIRQANAPINSTGNGEADAWVGRGGSPADFYSPDRGPAKPLVGEPIGPPRMMPMAMREAIKSHPNPWVGLGGNAADFYDPNSGREMQRQSDNAQMAKIRRIQAMFAPPSQSAIEQTMQNQAMGYAPEYQAAYLRDVQSRSADRLRAAAEAINSVYNQDIGMRQADVQDSRTNLEANIAGQGLNQEAMLELLKNSASLPPEVVKRLQQTLIQRVPFSP